MAKPSKQNYIFTKETLESLSDLGEVFRQIHNNLIKDGYTIKYVKINGQICKKIVRINK